MSKLKRRRNDTRMLWALLLFLLICKLLGCTHATFVRFIQLNQRYRGKVATEADEANHEMTNLDWGRAIEDIKNAVKYLKSKGAEKVSDFGGGMVTTVNTY